MTCQKGLSLQEKNGKRETTAGSERASHVIQAISLIFLQPSLEVSHEKELFHAKAKKETMGLHSEYSCLGKTKVLALCLE